ncbi:hypothetical protein SAMN04488112_12012 [Melghirimyces thermohalophilus]|uniref:YprB ribonuclease H-like domain-containing protein n=1 Tax=Melghirimyces thermohalophilus TaxID=1236220 RepID=A0A1G6Q8X2_9BACL|nr:ribonuclease H-like domain-containing protein [Melghirimyces thermohalophilus]SDC88097.1 hypothetical protein SAMN04488112_12012 [Melghirimyces thermohalophilus]
MSSSLRDRLQRHFKRSTPSDTPVAEKPEPHLKQSADRFGFTWRENERGGYLHRRQVFSAEMQHGRYALGEMLQGSSEFLMKNGTGFEELLFFDTETTGLGTGAGNLIFLYGIGYFQEASFVLEHYFLPQVGDEAALLQDFLEQVASFSVVVTYNGKAFDWNQLRTRTTLHRLPWAGEKEQCDLLYPSRRLWSRWLPSCRLQEVESACLGLIREDDTPGNLAPLHYFQFLKDRDLSRMSGVFDHNERDVLSLATLFTHLQQLLEGRQPPGNPEEAIALGQWWERSGRVREAFARYEALLSDRKTPLHIRRQAYRAASRIRKGEGHWADAVQLWQRWMDEDLWNPEPCVELAKFYEHRTREAERAHQMTLEAMHRLSKRGRLGSQPRKKEMDALKYRLRRLEQKREQTLF